MNLPKQVDLQEHVAGQATATTIMVYTTENPSGFTPFSASIVSVLYTISYVGVLYISPLSRPHPNLPRDSPSVIRVRIRAVTLVTIVALVVTSSITFATTSNQSLFEVLSFLGLSPTPSSVADIFRSLLLTAILFTGPLVQRLCFDNGLRDIKDDVKKMFYTWTGWRNYVAVCFSLVEHLVFVSRFCDHKLHSPGLFFELCKLTGIFPRRPSRKKWYSVLAWSHYI